MSGLFDHLSLGSQLDELTPGELTALADLCERERWVWEQVGRHSGDDEERAKARRYVDLHRDRSRRFRELAAESEAQDDNEGGTEVHG